MTAPQIGITNKDGSLIIDSQVVIDGLTLRYKISAPSSALVGGTNTPNTVPLGLNCLLHGDGGASFEDFPNKLVQNGLMGLVVLAPNEALLWGGQSTRQVQRPDGVAHAIAVDKLIRETLPGIVNFDPANVWFTGVSGGSLTLSGFFLPMFMSRYRTGAMLLCGGMAPPEGRTGLVDTLDAETLGRTRIHWESSQQELPSLKTTIPAAVRYYESRARQVGMKDEGINVLQTADATPTAGHCAFDNEGFNSGIQLALRSFGRVLQPGGDGIMQGIGPVGKGVVGRENLFT